MLWSAARVAEELDLASPRAVRGLMDSLGVAAVYLGPGRGRGYRWRPEEIRRAIESREVGKPEKKANRRRRKTVFDQGLSVGEQMAALMSLGTPGARQ